jgi:hypothetical protein
VPLFLKKKVSNKKRKNERVLKPFIFPGFNPTKDKVWLSVYKPQMSFFEKIILFLRNLSFFLFWRISLKDSNDIPIKNILQAKKKVKEVSEHFFDYKNATIGEEFIRFCLPIYLLSNQVMQVVKNIDKDSPMQFLNLFSNYYLENTQLKSYLEQFNEEHIKSIFQKLGILDAFRYLNAKHKEVEDFLQYNVPDGLKEALFFLEVLRSIFDYVDWKNFFSLYGTIENGSLKIIKRPKAQAVVPYIVQLSYIINNIPNNFEQFRVFNKNFSETLKTLLKEKELTSIISLKDIDQGIENIKVLKETKVIDSLLLLLVQSERFTVLGAELSRGNILNYYIATTLDTINNVIYNVREQEIKNYTKHIMKDFLQIDAATPQVQVGLYNEENSQYLRSVKLEGFTFSIFLPVLLTYFKVVYPRLSRTFLNTLVFNMSYEDTKISQRILDNMNKMLWHLSELHYYIKDHLLVPSNYSTEIFQLLDSKDISTFSLRSLTEVASQIREINSMLKKHLQNIAEFLSLLREDIFLIKDDIVNFPTKIVDSLQPLPKVKGEAIHYAQFLHNT